MMWHTHCSPRLEQGLKAHGGASRSCASAVLKALGLKGNGRDAVPMEAGRLVGPGFTPKLCLNTGGWEGCGAQPCTDLFALADGSVLGSPGHPLGWGKIGLRPRGVTDVHFPNPPPPPSGPP